MYVLSIGFLSKEAETHSLIQEVKVVLLSLTFSFAEFDSPAVTWKLFSDG